MQGAGLVGEMNAMVSTKRMIIDNTSEENNPEDNGADKLMHAESEPIDQQAPGEATPDKSSDADQGQGKTSIATADYPSEIVEQLELSAEAREIAATLEEPMVWMIQNAIQAVGLETVQAVVKETLAIEEEGGMLTQARDRKRTPGGVFFKLLKERADREASKKIFEPPQPIKEYLETTKPKGPAQPSPLEPLPWPKVRTVVNKLLEQPLEKCIVRITLMGRPSQVSKTKSCVVIALKGQKPPSLPKGLPPVPEDAEYSFAVFIAHKHWARVAPIMAQDANAKLVVEGYPVFDGKRGVTVVLAQHTRVTNSGFRHRQAASFR